MFNKLLIIHLLTINLYCQINHKFSVPTSNSISLTYSDNSLFDIKKYSTTQTNILRVKPNWDIHFSNTYKQISSAFYRKHDYQLDLGGTFHKDFSFLYQRFTWNSREKGNFELPNKYKAVIQIDFSHKWVVDWQRETRLSYLYLHEFEQGIGLSFLSSSGLSFEWVFQSPNYIMNLEYLPKNQTISMSISLSLIPKMWSLMRIKNTRDIFQEKEYSLDYLYSIQ